MPVSPKYQFWLALSLFADAELGGQHARLEHMCEFNAFPENVRYAKCSVLNAGSCRVMCAYIEFTSQMRANGLRALVFDEPVVWIPCIGPRTKGGNIPLSFIADAIDVDFIKLEHSWEFGIWVRPRTKSLNVIYNDNAINILYPSKSDSYDIIHTWKCHYVRTKNYLIGEPSKFEELDILIRSIQL